LIIGSVIAMERVTYRGRRFVLELAYSHLEWKGVKSGEYYDTKAYYHQWCGEGRITRLADGGVQVFIFTSKTIEKHWSTVWYDSFEKVLFNAGLIAGSAYGDGVYLELEKTTDKEAMVDLVAEALERLVESDEARDTIIPHLTLPVIDKEVLRARGLLGEEDGQLRLVLCG
jgi:hypothetical protein